MTRKRAKKLLMAKGLSRNAAEKCLDAKWPGITNGNIYAFELLNMEWMEWNKSYRDRLEHAVAEFEHSLIYGLDESRNSDITGFMSQFQSK